MTGELITGAKLDKHDPFRHAVRKQARNDPDYDPRAKKPSDAARAAGKDMRSIEADHTPVGWTPATDERRPARKISAGKKPLIKRSPTESAPMSSVDYERMMLALARRIAARSAALKAITDARIVKPNLNRSNKKQKPESIQSLQAREILDADDAKQRRLRLEVFLDRVQSKQRK